MVEQKGILFRFAHFVSRSAQVDTKVYYNMYVYVNFVKPSVIFVMIEHVFGADIISEVLFYCVV